MLAASFLINSTVLRHMSSEERILRQTIKTPVGVFL
jgi:hypothetical protein